MITYQLVKKAVIAGNRTGTHLPSTSVHLNFRIRGSCIAPKKVCLWEEGIPNAQGFLKTREKNSLSPEKTTYHSVQGGRGGRGMVKQPV